LSSSVIQNQSHSTIDSSAYSDEDADSWTGTTGKRAADKKPGLILPGFVAATESGDDEDQFMFDIRTDEGADSDP
jgi:hypothetical protein